jgi:hypothetical protein
MPTKWGTTPLLQKQYIEVEHLVKRETKTRGLKKLGGKLLLDRSLLLPIVDHYLLDT